MAHPRPLLTTLLGLGILCAQDPRPQAPPSTLGSPGLGDLMVAPTRVVFEGRKRAEEISLTNTGTVTALYRIAFIQMRMKPDGSLEELAAKVPGEFYADELIRFSPRQVSLQPGESQVVRLQVRKPEDLAPGEYRSHMVFRAVPPADPVKPADEKPTEGITIKLTPIYGVSIPIVVRHGDTQATCTLADLRLDEGGKALALRVERSGNRSVYGALRVYFLGGDQRELLGEIKGVAVYRESASRPFRVPLAPRKGGMPLKQGQLQVVFETLDTPSQVLATRSLDLQ